MQTVNLVKAAMREKAPALYRSLQEKGDLNQYVTDLSSEISSEIVRLTQEQRRREHWDKLGAMACAAKMRSADLLNQEIVLADLLEFPPDGTSPQNQD